MTTRELFTRIFINRQWSGPCVSGRGSTLSETAVIKSKIEAFVLGAEVKSILDLGCGDSTWISTLKLEGITYTGMDTVPALIENNKKCVRAGWRFVVGDPVLGTILPKVDLVICRDCLVHHNLGGVKIILNAIRRSGSKYMMLTTFPSRTSNTSIKTGQWHPMNLQIHPYNLPAPLLILNEECQAYKGKYADKSLGVWGL
jgi:SAM-dependent methyltransferase